MSTFDFEIPYPATVPFSHVFSSGDRFLYNGRVHTIKTFYYERALLSYVVKTVEHGEVLIPDEDWYHWSNIMISPENFSEEFFTKVLTVDENFADEVLGEWVLYEDEFYKVYRIEINLQGVVASVVHDDNFEKNCFVQGYTINGNEDCFFVPFGETVKMMGV